MSSYLDKKEGVFSPMARYAVTNPMEEDFIFTWGGQPIKISAKETIELDEYLALLATKRIVDTMMIGEETIKTRKIQETHPEYKASNVGGALGIPALRKPYEDKVFKKLEDKKGNEAVLNIGRFKEQIKNDLAKGAIPPASIESISVNKNEFSELSERSATTLSV